MKQTSLLLGIIISLAACKQKPAEESEETTAPHKNVSTRVEVFSNAESGDSSLGGYGYMIYVDSAADPYIKQPHIPAIPGNKAFADSLQAMKAAELVAYKIRNNVMPPSVSTQELDSLGIRY